MLNICDLSLRISSKNRTKILCREVNIEILPGEIWGILGPNGSGKTTLLHTLAGIRQENISVTGHIHLDKKSLTAFSQRELAQVIGIVFQELPQSDWHTVWEYCLGARFPHRNYFGKTNLHDAAIVSRALEEVQLASHLHQPIKSLSGGEKRRLAIATVLAQTPRWYFLDEPMNHLDIYHQKKVMRTLQKLTPANTVIFTTHDINIAEQLCKNIILLFPDEVLTGKVADLLTCENLSRLYQYPVEYITTNYGRIWFSR